MIEEARHKLGNEISIIGILDDDPQKKERKFSEYRYSEKRRISFVFPRRAAQNRL